MSAIPFTKFTGLDMLKIDIANAYGLDKELYSDRIEWFNVATSAGHGNLFNNPDYFIERASDPLLLKKAVMAYNKATQGIPTGHNMFMDATASGLQLMAVLSQCEVTASACNLIDNGERNDPYTLVTDEMIARLPHSTLFDGHTAGEIRSLVKPAIMTHFYNSVAEPIKIFGEDTPELETFYEVLSDLFPGAEDILAIINSCWNSEATEHSWTLPDGHVAKVKVMEAIDTKIQADELGIGELGYRFYVNQPSELSTSLAPNIIHSIDGYVVREMVRMAKEQGFQLAHIHDAFTCHPNHMTKAMANYRTILATIADMNLLGSILNEVAGEDLGIEVSGNLAPLILESQYALS